MIARLFSFLFLLIGLAGLFAAGWVAWEHLKADRTSLPAELSYLENDRIPEGTFFTFETALADYSGIAHPEPKTITSSEGVSSRVIPYLYYPVISEQHREARAFRHNGEDPRLLNPTDRSVENFRVIVRDYRIHRVEDFPKGIHRLGLENVIFLGTARELPTEDQSLLFTAYPQIELNHLYVLDAGWEPLPWSWALGYLLLSFICFSLCLLIAYLQKSPEERKTYHGLGLRNPFHRSPES